MTANPAPKNSSDTNPSAHRFNPVILREYDIRGKIGIDLNEDDAAALGLAFGTFLKNNTGKDNPTMAVGYDGRESSQGLAQKLMAALCQIGVQVECIGLGPTPMLYYAVKEHKKDAGIMITGSHNPKEYNGFKMTLYNAPVYGDLIQEIGAIATNGSYALAEGNNNAQSPKTIDVQDSYIARLLQDYKPARPLKIAWDAGNGAAGEALQKLVTQLPGEHIVLYAEIDGTFPNHHPDPTVDKNLTDLRKTVLDNECDLGIAFDGDGDRIGVLDEQGNILRCDVLLALYAAELLERTPGAPIIGDVKCSQVLFDEIARLGGNPIMWNTGHSLVKAKMAEETAPLAGELSGHIFFADQYYGFDDALYCAIRLLNIREASDKPLSELYAHMPKLISTPEIRIEVDESTKFDIVPQLLENIKNLESDGFQINTIDGIRVTTGEGWWLLRPSNTQNALVARIEAQSEEALDKFKDFMATQLAKLGISSAF